MSRRQNRRNIDWETPENPHFRWEHVTVEVLMDIRQELKRLNELLHCHNAVGMPQTLKKIDRRLQKHMPLPIGRPRK